MSEVESVKIMDLFMKGKMSNQASSFYFFAKNTDPFMKGACFCMRKYNVMEIANLLKVNEETVRRWIRSGYLKSTITSMKNGYVINEQDLYEFVRTKPKYRTMLGSLEVQIDDTYIEKRKKLLNDLISERDRINDCINKIQSLLEKL